MPAFIPISLRIGPLTIVIVAKEVVLLDRAVIPLAARARITGKYSGLAPAIVVTAGFDPLVDEGAAYAEKLSAAGVEVTYVCEHSAGHGILTMSGLSRSCMAASDRCVRLLTDFIESID